MVWLSVKKVFDLYLLCGYPSFYKMHTQQKTTPRKRNQGFNDLAEALGLSSSGLRRWARRVEIPGVHFVRGRWILKGPLTAKRVDFIRRGLRLNPSINHARKHGPVLTPRTAPKWLKREVRRFRKDGNQSTISSILKALSEAPSDEHQRILAQIPEVAASLIGTIRPMALEERKRVASEVQRQFPEFSELAQSKIIDLSMRRFESDLLRVSGLEANDSSIVTRYCNPVGAKSAKSGKLKQTTNRPRA
jgi:hypothetical protein